MSLRFATLATMSISTLVGLGTLFQFDLVAALFGPASVLSRLVYSLVGLAGIALAGIAATTLGTHRHAAMAFTSH